MAARESTAAIQPLEDEIQAPAASKDAATPEKLGHVASVVGCLALIVISSFLIAGRGVNLTAFLLGLLSFIALAALVWRLRALWLLLHLEQAPARGALGPISRLASLPVWRDSQIRWLLASALATNLAIFGYVSDRFNTLPPFLPLHYSAVGEVDRLGTPTEVFIMPSIGLVVFLANSFFATTLYRRERQASLLLAGSTIFVQMVLFVATINIISRA